MRNLPRHRWRLLGVFVLIAGIALAVGSAALSQVRFPLTNYTSEISVARPTVYYEHRWFGGDVIFFELHVDGGPVEMEIWEGPRDELGEYRASVQDAPVFRATDLLGFEEIRFTVPSTDVYRVEFRSSCLDACTGSSLRAQLQEAIGTLGSLPISVATVVGAAGAATGSLVLAAAHHSASHHHPNR